MNVPIREKNVITNYLISFQLKCSYKNSKTFQVKLNTPLPGIQEGEAHNHQSDLILYLNPSCVYTIAVRPAISEMWGQMVRQYYPMILSFMVSLKILLLNLIGYFE